MENLDLRDISGFHYLSGIDILSTDDTSESPEFGRTIALRLDDTTYVYEEWYEYGFYENADGEVREIIESNYFVGDRTTKEVKPEFMFSSQPVRIHNIETCNGFPCNINKVYSLEGELILEFGNLWLCPYHAMVVLEYHPENIINIKGGIVMPNYCDYQMVVRGFPKAVEEFIHIIQADYNYEKGMYGYNGRHLYRVFASDITSDTMNGMFRDVSISGYCAWSVYSCMMEGPHTYYDDTRNHLEGNEDVSHGTSLIKEAKRLNLVIEVYSTEPGIGFEEHYLISNSYFNPVLINEERTADYYFPACHDNVKDFNKEYNLRMDEEYFKLLSENEMEYVVGGFGCQGFVLDNTPIQIVKKILAKKVNKGGK